MKLYTDIMREIERESKELDDCENKYAHTSDSVGQMSPEDDSLIQLIELEAGNFEAIKDNLNQFMETLRTNLCKLELQEKKIMERIKRLKTKTKGRSESREDHQKTGYGVTEIPSEPTFINRFEPQAVQDKEKKLPLAREVFPHEAASTSNLDSSMSPVHYIAQVKLLKNDEQEEEPRGLVQLRLNQPTKEQNEKNIKLRAFVKLSKSVERNENNSQMSIRPRRKSLNQRNPLRAVAFKVRDSLRGTPEEQLEHLLRCLQEAQIPIEMVEEFIFKMQSRPELDSLVALLREKLAKISPTNSNNATVLTECRTLSSQRHSLKELCLLAAYILRNMNHLPAVCDAFTSLASKFEQQDFIGLTPELEKLESDLKERTSYTGYVKCDIKSIWSSIVSMELLLDDLEIVDDVVDCECKLVLETLYDQFVELLSHLKLQLELSDNSNAPDEEATMYFDARDELDDLRLKHQQFCAENCELKLKLEAATNRLESIFEQEDLDKPVYVISKEKFEHFKKKSAEVLDFTSQDMKQPVNQYLNLVLAGIENIRFDWQSSSLPKEQENELEVVKVLLSRISTILKKSCSLISPEMEAVIEVCEYFSPQSEKRDVKEEDSSKKMALVLLDNFRKSLLREKIDPKDPSFQELNFKLNEIRNKLLREEIAEAENHDSLVWASNTLLQHCENSRNQLLLQVLGQYTQDVEVFPIPKSPHADKSSEYCDLLRMLQIRDTELQYLLACHSPCFCSKTDLDDNQTVEECKALAYTLAAQLRMFEQDYRLVPPADLSQMPVRRLHDILPLECVASTSLKNPPEAPKPRDSVSSARFNYVTS
ncbi:hypothetical protein Ciccas_006052 [Cichlidogyrus casuarinus]|uniref:Uncharacterized protein n=1 Tax=Cichlidogyrus casuarinus TaxID=1844966 RepID=A0ABD2Q6X5_9PLAT